MKVITCDIKNDEEDIPKLHRRFSDFIRMIYKYLTEIGNGKNEILIHGYTNFSKNNMYLDEEEMKCDAIFITKTQNVKNLLEKENLKVEVQGEDSVWISPIESKEFDENDCIIVSPKIKE